MWTAVAGWRADLVPRTGTTAVGWARECGGNWEEADALNGVEPARMVPSCFALTGTIPVHAGLGDTDGYRDTGEVAASSPASRTGFRENPPHRRGFFYSEGFRNCRVATAVGPAVGMCRTDSGHPRGSVLSTCCRASDRRAFEDPFRGRDRRSCRDSTRHGATPRAPFAPRVPHRRAMSAR